MNYWTRVAFTFTRGGASVNLPAGQRVSTVLPCGGYGPVDVAITESEFKHWHAFIDFSKLAHSPLEALCPTDGST